MMIVEQRVYVYVVSSVKMHKSLMVIEG